MKANKLILLLALVTAGLFSCEKEIEYKGEGKDPVLVVNAIVQNDSVFRVYLERSFFFLSDEPTNNKYISSGATVTVTNVNSGDVYVMTSSTYDNVYDFPFITAPSTTYRIDVQHADYPSVTTQITTAPNVTLLSADTSSYTTSDGALRKKALLKWNDPAGENYYILRLFYEDPFNNYGYQMSYFCDDEVTSGQESDPTSSNKPSFTDLVFSDEFFNGELKPLEIEFDTYYGGSPQNNPIYTYRLVTITKEAYLYYQTAQKSQNTGPFSEPVKVYNNIDGGFGIFGSLNNSQIVK